MAGVGGGRANADGDGGTAMTGVYARSVGDAIEDLHPKVRERYGNDPEDGVVCIGRGTMDIDHAAFALPALYAMTTRNLLFPETGTDVPFTVTSAEYRTDAGHQVLGMRREFEFDGTTRRFDSRTLWDEAGERLLDFLGSDGGLVSELRTGVEDGDLVVESGRQWLRLGTRYLRLPGPLAADVTVRDRFDDDGNRYTVHAKLRNTLVGDLFRFEGSFTQELQDRPVPEALRPNRDLSSLPPR